MPVNQTAHDGGLRAAKRFCLLLQKGDMLAFHFQGYGFHAAKVVLLWQQVNTRKYTAIVAALRQTIVFRGNLNAALCGGAATRFDRARFETRSRRSRN